MELVSDPREEAKEENKQNKHNSESFNCLIVENYRGSSSEVNSNNNEGVSAR